MSSRSEASPCPRLPPVQRDPTPAIPLAPDVADVWLLDHAHRDADHWWELLSHEERSRAVRIRSTRDRHTWAAGRAMLRLALGRYLGVAPRSLAFGRTRYGRPFLAAPNGTGLHFTLSHAGSGAAVAVARTPDIGVDLEPLRDIPDAMGIARSFFCPSEIDVLSRLRHLERACAFLEYWTAKEAVAKAIGLGLAAPFDRIAVSPGVGVVHPFRTWDGSSVAESRWRLVRFRLPDAFLLTLAVPEARPLQVHLRHAQPPSLAAPALDN